MNIEYFVMFTEPYHFNEYTYFVAPGKKETKIIYIADAVGEDRKYDNVPELYNLSKVSLDEACLLLMDNKRENRREKNDPWKYYKS